MKTLYRYDEYLNSIDEICSQKKLILRHKHLNNGYKFLHLKVSNDAKSSICFSAGVHGDEIAGPYAILKFLQEETLPKVNVLFLPVVNPHGFDRDIRTNAQKQDINRRFCDKILTGEARAAYDIIHKHQCNLFVSLHEWSGRDGYYMYASDKSKKTTIEKIPKLASSSFKIMTNKINGEQVENGVIWHPEEGYPDDRSRCTLENKVYLNDIHYICTETPSQAPLEKRIECQIKIMKFVLENMI